MATHYQVMARLFVFMNGAPLNNSTQKRAAEALKVFREICPWFGKLVPTVVREQLPQMLTAVEGRCNLCISNYKEIEIINTEINFFAVLQTQLVFLRQCLPTRAGPSPTTIICRRTTTTACQCNGASTTHRWS